MPLINLDEESRGESPIPGLPRSLRARESRIPPFVTFFRNVTHPPANSQESHFVVSPRPAGQPGFLGFLLSRLNNRAQNRAPGGIKASVLTKSDESGDLRTFARFTHFWTLFVTFARFRPVYSGVRARITHLFLDIPVRTPLSDRPNPDILVILVRSRFHPVLRQEFHPGSAGLRTGLFAASRSPGMSGISPRVRITQE